MLNSEIDNTHESMEHTITKSSTLIPHHCGNLSVDEQSSLSKTQKKRLKAKSKGKGINKGVNSQSNDNMLCNDPQCIELPEINFVYHKPNNKANLFKHMYMKDQKPSITLTHDDPLIIAIQEVVQIQLGHIKLDDDGIKSVVKIVNDRHMKDLWRVGWGIKNEMLHKWFDKYNDEYKNN